MKRNVFHTLLASFMLAGVSGGNVDAADFTVAAGESVYYTSLADFNQTSNVTGPGADEEKGVFYMDITDNQFVGNNRYKGTISGNLDLYYTGNQNWRTYCVNTYTGDTYIQSTASVYITTGKEFGTGTIYWQGNGGHLVNEGNEQYRTLVLDNNIVMNSGSHILRAGWNTENNPASFTVNGIISGDGSLRFNDGEFTPGTFYLNGANTYTGGTNLRGTWQSNAINRYATYVLGNNSAFGTGTVTAEGDVLIDVSKITQIENNLVTTQFTDKSQTFATSVVQNTGANAFTLGNSNSTINVKSALEILNSGAGSINIAAGTANISGTLALENSGTGSVSIGSSSAYVDLTGNGTLAFNSSATAYLGKFTNIQGPTAEGQKATVYFKPSQWAEHYYSKLSGNLDLVFNQSMRLYNSESDFTGTITINNANIYLNTGHELGGKKENTITYNNGGQLVNQNRSAPVVQNDIVLNATVVMRAGWNGTNYDGGDKSSITLNGDISGVGGIQFKGETNAGAIYLRGNNTFSGDVLVEYGYSAGSSANHRCWFGIGSDSAFGTGKITVNTSIPTTVFDFETETSDKTLNNKIVVNQNTLQFRNSGENDAYITGTITGSTSLPIQFGSQNASENGGRIFFNGSSEKTVTVNPGMTLGGSGSLADLALNNDATLYLSSAVNYGTPMTISSLTLDGNVNFELDETVGLDKILLDSKSTMLGDDFAITIAYDGDASQISANWITVASFGSGVELENLVNSLSLSGGLDSWTPLMSNGVLTLASTNAVPEPGTWTLILLALPALCLFRKNKK